MFGSSKNYRKTRYKIIGFHVKSDEFRTSAENTIRGFWWYKVFSLSLKTWKQRFLPNLPLTLLKQQAHYDISTYVSFFILFRPADISALADFIIAGPYSSGCFTYADVSFTLLNFSLIATSLVHEFSQRRVVQLVQTTAARGLGTRLW